MQRFKTFMVKLLQKLAALILGVISSISSKVQHNYAPGIKKLFLGYGDYSLHERHIFSRITSKTADRA